MTIDWPKIKYVPEDRAEEGYWAVKVNGVDVYGTEMEGAEMCVPGGADGPDASRLEFARRVAPHLEAMDKKAQNFLDCFANTARLDGGGAYFQREGCPTLWELSWVDFRRAPDATERDIDLCYLRETDPYGVWSVRSSGDAEMKYAPSPSQFTRRSR